MAKAKAKAPVLPGVENTPPVIVCLPVGCGIELMTGEWVKAVDGRYVLSGGVSQYESVIQTNRHF